MTWLVMAADTEAKLEKSHPPSLIWDDVWVGIIVHSNAADLDKTY